jgi:flotillin
MQSLPPLFSTIHDQTGISPPAWLAQLPPQQSAAANDKAKAFAANANGTAAK